MTYLHVRDFHPLRSHFPKCSISLYHSVLQSYYPVNAETITVWAMPRSLAATGGITIVFFSCRYLDVSVPCVCLPCGMLCLQHNGLTHSDICGSQVICTYPQLFAAYHVLLPVSYTHLIYVISYIFFKKNIPQKFVYDE